MVKKILISVGIIIAISIIGAVYLSNRSGSESQVNLPALMANLKKKYPSVKETYIYSESRDPNGNLGKAGYYTAGAEFYDTRTNTEPDGKAFGADSGGAIEVYANSPDASKRVDYLKAFQGSSFLDPGAFKRINNIVIRASSKYKASDQTDVIQYLTSQIKQ
jgi:hypothetical protein